MRARIHVRLPAQRRTAASNRARGIIRMHSRDVLPLKALAMRSYVVAFDPQGGIARTLGRSSRPANESTMQRELGAMRRRSDRTGESSMGRPTAEDQCNRRLPSAYFNSELGLASSVIGTVVARSPAALSVVDSDG